MPKPIEQYFSVKEVAAKLHVSPRTVWRWIYDRQLTYTKIAGSVRIKESDLRKLLAACQVRKLPDRVPPILKRAMKSKLRSDA